MIDAAAERQLAIDLFNHVWTLLEKPDRTAAEDAEMVHAAHASCYHWQQVGTAVNVVRGEWQCSRVYAVLGRSEPALQHARRALALCEQGGIGGFDLGCAFEALARAHSVAGDSAEAQGWLDRGRSTAAGIADDEDRQVLLSDLDTIVLRRGSPTAVARSEPWAQTQASNSAGDSGWE